MVVHYLQIEDVLYIYSEIVGRRYVFDQPNVKALENYPRERVIEILDSLEKITQLPQQAIFGKDAYPTIEEKAAILFITLTKNHIFENGNKRTAVYSLFLFMCMNGKWLDFKHQQLYKISEGLAKQDGSQQNFDEVKRSITEIIKEHVIVVSEGEEMPLDRNFIQRLYDRIIGYNE